jgi:hypothetical protein
MKISTIITGTIMNNCDKKPSVTKKETPSGVGAKLKELEHKVKTTSDSHIKGNDTRVNQYPNTKFEVCFLIKPSAKKKRH